MSSESFVRITCDFCGITTQEFEDAEERENKWDVLAKQDGWVIFIPDTARGLKMLCPECVQEVVDRTNKPPKPPEEIQPEKVKEFAESILKQQPGRRKRCQ